MEINRTILDYMRTGGGPPYAADVVLRERGKTYIRYDAVRIGNATDAGGGVSVQFLWQGAAVAWVRVFGATLEGIKMHSTDVAGRLEVDPQP